MIKKLHKSIKELGLFGGVLAFAVIAPGIGALVLAGTSDSWLNFLRESQYGILIFAISGILLTGISLIPTHAVSLIAGMLLGTVLGPVYALLIIILASLLSYYATKMIVGDSAVSVICQKPQANEVYKALLRENFVRTVLIISLVRLSPVMPFAGTNVLLASAKVNLKEFLLGSAVGLAPRVIIVAISGATLTQLDLSQKSNTMILILGIVATIAAIGVLGHISKKVLSGFVKNN